MSLQGNTLGINERFHTNRPNLGNHSNTKLFFREHLFQNKTANNPTSPSLLLPIVVVCNKFGLPQGTLPFSAVCCCVITVSACSRDSSWRVKCQMPWKDRRPFGSCTYSKTVIVFCNPHWRRFSRSCAAAICSCRVLQGSHWDHPWCHHGQLLRWFDALCCSFLNFIDSKRGLQRSVC